MGSRRGFIVPKVGLYPLILLIGILSLWQLKIILLGLICGALFIGYVLIPTIFYWSPTVQKHIVFQHKVNVPKKGFDFNSLEKVGIRGGRNLYLHSDADVLIGVWHIMPQSELPNCSTDNDETAAFNWEDSMRSRGKGVVIYVHGNTGTRALEHRVELYKLIQKEDFHVIAFDYRGFGDSTAKPPSETGAVTDALSVHNWVCQVTSGRVPIFFWGHSLGTGISLHAVSKLCRGQEGNLAAGLILESPFSNFCEAVARHKLTRIYRMFPGFTSLFVPSLIQNDISFESDRHIKDVTLPILILHAIDDSVIPLDLGRKLFEAGKQQESVNKSQKIYFREFGEGFAHKFICRSPVLPSIIRSFTESCSFDTWPCKQLVH